MIDWDIINTKECDSDPHSDCPMLDPADHGIHKQILNMIKVPFKGSCSAGGCECQLQVHPLNFSTSLPAGIENFQRDLITIINVGSQIAEHIEVIIQND